MFLPLLQMVGDEGINSEDLGSLDFVVDFLQSMGITFHLFSILAFMSLFFFLKGIVYYFTGVYKVNVQQDFITRLRIQGINKLNNLSYTFFVQSDPGRIQNALTGEIARVSRSFLTYFSALQYGIMVVVFMAFAFSIDAQFAVLVTIGGILTNFLYKNLYSKTKELSKTLTHDSNKFQNLLIQNVSNFKYLKATGSSKLYQKKLNDSVLKIEKSNKKIGHLDALLSSGREPLLIILVVFVIYLQTQLMGSKLAPILISLIFFYRALNYLMQMQVNWNKFLAVSGSIENISSYNTEFSTNVEILGSKEFNESIKKLTLRAVSFAYEQNVVLKNITFEVSTKETVAFVGESGSGKTTLVNILSGLLPVEKGNYEINDKSYKEWNISSFQKKVGYITQDPVIFNDTLFNNVTFWAEPDLKNIAKFRNAVRKAAIAELVESLPEKEETVLGSNGINLSGGQKQRISIARELFKEVDILILDEATSALDSETEKEIQANIDNLRGKYMIFIIAHRISTIKNADRIILMKDGKINTMGDFQSLSKNSPDFSRLVELQEI